MSNLRKSGGGREESGINIEVSRGASTHRHLQMQHSENLNLMFYDFNKSALRSATLTREQ